MDNWAMLAQWIRYMYCTILREGVVARFFAQGILGNVYIFSYIRMEP
jgi:hypothetical protein